MEQKEIKCLDKGFVRLVDHLGDDSRIVQSARVSYGTGTKSYREDKALLCYLIRNFHTSPLEQVSFTFHCKMPIFVARQWVRHRTAKLNEISGRYSEMKDEFYVPEVEDISYQSKNNKQGRSDEKVSKDHQEKTLEILINGQKESYDDYKDMLDLGIARELARINLPLSTYTEWYWTMDLHNLFHFLKLRMDGHAQKEIRVYAEAIYELIKPIVPFACEAFEEHILFSKTFSRKEFDVLDDIINSLNRKDFNSYVDAKMDDREKRIFFEKLGIER